MFPHFHRHISKPDSAKLSLKGKVLNIEKNRKLYCLPIKDNIANNKVNAVHDLCLQGWHEILGHCNFENVIHLEKVADIMMVQSKNIRPNECEVCLHGKMIKIGTEHLVFVLPSY